MKHITWLLVTAFALTLSFACGDKKSKDDKGKTPAADKDKADKGGDEFDEAKVKELSSLDIPGFKRLEAGGPGMKGMAMPNYEQEAANANGCKAFVMVHAQKCMMCQPMDVAKWKENENIKSMLPTIHKDNPNLVWEVEELEAEGKKAISIYDRSFVAQDNGKATSHGLMVHYNNNVNQMIIQISARGCPSAADEEALKNNFTKDEMLAVAKSFLGAFATKL